MIRNREIPVKVSEDELAKLAQSATAANLPLSSWVRRKLGLPLAKMGRPPKPTK